MKKFALLFLSLGLVLAACNKDDNEFDLENTLYYDGPNRTAPNLPAGDYEAAARFTSTETAAFRGRNLIEVSFFLLGIPDNCTIKIYSGGGPAQPGTLVYSAAVSNSLRTGWNNHELRRPVEITDEDLWISISLTHSATRQSIGCDAGPANLNGDWLYRDSDQNWRSFRAVAGESINWNIRGRVGQ